MESLKGKLLISSAGLYDPNFRHTVVLIAAHDEEGAVGVILNRPTDLTVTAVLPLLAELTGPDALLFQGGPVKQDESALLVELDDPTRLDLLVFEGVGFLTGEVSSSIHSSVLRARIFVGYAGWGPGQLEDELAEDSWIIEPARADDVFTEEPASLWKRILMRKGPEYRQIAMVPFDPRVN